MNKQTDASLRNFRSRYDPKHVLHPLLAQPKNSGQNNRQRTHNQVLSIDVNAVIRQNFSHIIVTFINRVHRVILRTVCYTPLSACAYAIRSNKVCNGVPTNSGPPAKAAKHGHNPSPSSRRSNFMKAEA